MNLFLPYSDAQTSVQSLDDKRVSKMILETAQLLSTAIHIVNPNNALPIYKVTHKNHPVGVWIRSSLQNYIYALNYFKVISEEHTYRTGNVHKSSLLYPIFMQFIADNPTAFPIAEQTPFANCTEFKQDEVHTAYKKTLLAKWQNDVRKPKWTNRSKPTWNL